MIELFLVFLIVFLNFWLDPKVTKDRDLEFLAKIENNFLKSPNSVGKIALLFYFVFSLPPVKQWRFFDGNYFQFFDARVSEVVFFCLSVF